MSAPDQGWLGDSSAPTWGSPGHIFVGEYTMRGQGMMADSWLYLAIDLVLLLAKEEQEGARHLLMLWRQRIIDRKEGAAVAIALRELIAILASCLADQIEAGRAK